MARPTKPKDLKPKMEGEAASPASSSGGGGGGFDLKFIILIVVVLLASVLGSVGSAFVMATMFIVPEISKVAQTAGPHPEGEAEAHGGAADPASTETPGHQIGMNLELDEFKVNLKSDPALEGSQFLAAKMALSIKVPEKENCYAQEGHASLPPFLRREGVIAGAAVPTDPTLLASEGEGAASCEDTFKAGMSKYVPTMRDVINAALMKRTATVLATLEGQETLKDEIKEQLNQIIAPDYEVLRVNFQDFIIQK